MKTIARNILPLALMTLGTLACRPNKDALVDNENRGEVRNNPVAVVEPGASIDMGDAEGEVFTVIGIRIDATLAQMCRLDSNKSFFKFDSAKLTDDAKERLTEISTCVTSGPAAGKKLELVGYASPPGTDAYNEKLGMSRAESAQGFLIKQGVKAENMQVDSAGEVENPGAPLDDMRWPYARRVDVRLAD